MKIFEVLYAFEKDGAEMWATRIYVVASDVQNAWIKASGLFKQDRHIVALRELPQGEVVLS
jgi:hypothetical protein